MSPSTSSGPRDRCIFVDSTGLSIGAFFRYKAIIGDGLRARSPGGRHVEASLACDVLNRMTALGRPKSTAIRR